MIAAMKSRKPAPRCRRAHANAVQHESGSIMCTSFARECCRTLRHGCGSVGSRRHKKTFSRAPGEGSCDCEETHRRLRPLPGARPHGPILLSRSPFDCARPDHRGLPRYKLRHCAAYSRCAAITGGPNRITGGPNRIMGGPNRIMGNLNTAAIPRAALCRALLRPCLFNPLASLDVSGQRRVSAQEPRLPKTRPFSRR